VTKLRVGRLVFDSRLEQGIFSLRHCVQADSGAYPAPYTIGTGGYFPGSKWQGRETSAELKNALLHTASWRGAKLNTGYVFMAWY